MNNQSLFKALSTVIEPDLKKDIISLDLVSDVQISEDSVSFTVSIQNAAMHARKRMVEACEFAIERFEGRSLKIDVNVVGMKKVVLGNQLLQATLQLGSHQKDIRWVCLMLIFMDLQLH